MKRTKRGAPRRRAAPGASAAERIELHARKEPSGCWVWGAATSGDGYGRLYLDGKLRFAHRVSYEATVGPIPEGLQIDHLCRNRSCVNPAHLEPVTPLVNVRRSPIHPGSRDACPRGHEYTEASTYRRGGRRYCRVCQAAYARIYKAMAPEERARRKAAGLPVVDLAAHFASQEAAA